MDHAEVLERLDASFVGPGKIWSVDTDGTPEGAALRQHLAGCAECRADYEALVLTAAALAVAAPESIEAPAWARERVLARVREVGVARGPKARGGTDGGDVIPLHRARRPAALLTGLAVAASVALLLLGGVLGRSLFPDGEPAGQEARQLASLATAMSDLVNDPGHRAVRLSAAGSADAGLVLVSGDGHRLAVTSQSIDEPEGKLYDCYVERGGQRTLIGWMHVDEGLAYWAGPVKAFDDIGRPGDRFIVLSREPGATPELTATF